MVVEYGGADQLQFDLRALLGEVWRRRWRILLVTGLLCAATFALLMFVPKEYESSASLLVEPRDNVFARAANDTGVSLSGVTDDVVVASQIELIQSADTLLRVVRDLNLDATKEFAGLSDAPLDRLMRLIRPQAEDRQIEQIALARLQKKLSVVRQRTSRVVSIIVQSQDRDLAAEIANAIANAHVNRRSEQSVDDTAEASIWLQTEITKLRTQVSTAEANVAQFRVDNDLFVGPNNTTLLNQQMADLSGQITAAQERRSTANSRAGLIRSLLNSGRPIDGVSDVRESVVIQRLSEDKATLQGQLAQLSASLMDSHPDVLAVRAQIAEINNQITIEGRRVADALESEAEIEDNLVQSLTADLTRLKLSAGSASSANVELQEMEREAKALRDLLETYLARFSDAASRTDSNAALPDVRVITFAVPALNPASPKTTLTLVAVLFVSLALQLGLILFRELSFVPHHAARDEDMARDLPAQMAISAAPPDDDEDPADYVVAQNDDLPAQVAKGPIFSDFDEVVQDILTGRTQTVMILSLDHSTQHAGLAEQMIMSALDEELSVALVDAGSGSISNRAGITDLSANRAEFGEVVHASDIPGLSEVMWGTLPRLASVSDRPATLVAALADIHEVIIVMAGTVGAGSNLRQFAGLDAHLVLAAGQKVDAKTYANIVARATEWGFGNLRLVHSGAVTANVA